LHGGVWSGWPWERQGHRRAEGRSASKLGRGGGRSRLLQNDGSSLGEACGSDKAKWTENQGDPCSVFHLVPPSPYWHVAIL